VISDSNADVLSIQTTSSSYTGNVLHLLSKFPGNSGFNFLKITDDARTIFSMDGYGNVNMNYGSLIVYGLDGTGGMTIAKGGLTVTGGLTGKI
jgi:hypothetical protein